MAYDFAKKNEVSKSDLKSARLWSKRPQKVSYTASDGKQGPPAACGAANNTLQHPGETFSLNSRKTTKDRKKRNIEEQRRVRTDKKSGEKNTPPFTNTLRVCCKRRWQNFRFPGVRFQLRVPARKHYKAFISFGATAK